MINAINAEELVILATCLDGSCPTVYSADDGSVVVQGAINEMDTPNGERAVSVPAQLIVDAAQRLRESGVAKA